MEKKWKASKKPEKRKIVKTTDLLIWKRSLSSLEML